MVDCVAENGGARIDDGDISEDPWCQTMVLPIADRSVEEMLVLSPSGVVAVGHVAEGGVRCSLHGGEVEVSRWRDGEPAHHGWSVAVAGWGAMAER